MESGTMRHQVKENRTGSMLRIELNQTCDVRVSAKWAIRADLSLRILKMLAHVAAIAGALAAIAEILHRW
jgi:hypothetical protein